jgi:transcriptional regulator with XRE-family HTH domain
MEFSEKLQELRKSRNLTQEELAEALFVSRTAVSKWESGRGYPSIDSLKEISRYFSVTIDDLLSGEKLLSLAQRENRSNIRSLCDLLFGSVDLLAFLLIVLPLYPKTVDGFVYAVNLITYAETSAVNRYIYWALFLTLALTGLLELLLQRKASEKQKTMKACSMILGIGTVLLLALAGETYAVAVAFLLLIIKGMLLLKYVKIR